MKRRFIYFSVSCLSIFIFGVAAAKDIALNGTVIAYSDLLQPHCELFLRHALGPYPKGHGSGYDWCRKYAASKDGDVINSLMSEPGVPPVFVVKRDYISLDDFPVWNGTPPIRARFSIGARHEDADPDIAPSYLPYGSNSRIEDYVMIDKDGYETNVKSGERTGYRFYDFLGVCYLATIKKPRMYKYLTDCQTKKAYDGFPKSVDVTSHQWINIMNQNTVDLYERMPADAVEIRGSNPRKPLIYSDFPIGDGGRVTKGRAMCMADCAPGMLMKLLHAGQSIWGSSGNPATVKQ